MFSSEVVRTLLLVCLGGALGSGLRYLISHALTGWALRQHGSTFPWATLAVNVVGSFLLGFLMSARAAGGGPSPAVRFALGTGLLGGFTTYSTFNFETLQLLHGGHWGGAAGNLAGTILACLLAGFLGMALARTLLP